MLCWSTSLKAYGPRSFPTHLRRLLVLSCPLEGGMPHPPVARPLRELRFDQQGRATGCSL
jgi:hypothetical protein